MPPGFLTRSWRTVTLIFTRRAFSCVIRRALLMILVRVVRWTLLLIFARGVGWVLLLILSGTRRPLSLSRLW